MQQHHAKVHVSNSCCSPDAAGVAGRGGMQSPFSHARYQRESLGGFMSSRHDMWPAVAGPLLLLLLGLLLLLPLSGMYDTSGIFLTTGINTSTHSQNEYSVKPSVIAPAKPYNTKQVLNTTADLSNDDHSTGYISSISYSPGAAAESASVPRPAETVPRHPKRSVTAHQSANDVAGFSRRRLTSDDTQDSNHEESASSFHCIPPGRVTKWAINSDTGNLGVQQTPVRRRLLADEVEFGIQQKTVKQLPVHVAAKPVFHGSSSPSEHARRRMFDNSSDRVSGKSSSSNAEDISDFEIALVNDVSFHHEVTLGVMYALQRYRNKLKVRYL